MTDCPVCFMGRCAPGAWPPPAAYTEARRGLREAGSGVDRSPREVRALARARRDRPGRRAELRREDRLIRQGRRAARAAA